MQLTKRLLRADVNIKGPIKARRPNVRPESPPEQSVRSRPHALHDPGQWKGACPSAVLVAPRDPCVRGRSPSGRMRRVAGLPRLSGENAPGIAEARWVKSGVEDEVGGHGRAYAPAHDAPGEGVHNEGRIEPALPDRDVGELGRPELVGPFGLEPRVHLVQRARRLGAADGVAHPPGHAGRPAGPGVASATRRCRVPPPRLRGSSPGPNFLLGH